jgi:phospholipid transport system substrate-binding protein
MINVRALARLRAVAATLLFAALAAVALPAAAQEAPDALVKRVSSEALATIKSDPQIQAGDVTHIRELIETKLAPHFDIMRMTALAMGKNWRTATPEQQKRLAEEFRTLLVRTYSTALNKYRDETIDYKPLRMNPADTEVTVRTQVVRQGGQPVQIDYSMAKTPDGWKAYDVVIGGVSLVTNYRDEFNQQVQSGGIDGLIKTLSERNKGAPAK